MKRELVLAVYSEGNIVFGLYWITSVSGHVFTPMINQDLNTIGLTRAVLKEALARCDEALKAVCKRTDTPIRVAGYSLTESEAQVFDVAQKFLQRHYDDAEWYSPAQIFRKRSDHYEQNRAILCDLLARGVMQCGFIEARQEDGKWYLRSKIGERTEDGSAVLD